MKQSLPTRKLPERPDLDQLRRQAKELLEALLAGEPSAVAEANRFYRHADAAKFALRHAQLVLARSYGFDSWPKLKAYVDGVTISRLTEAARAGDVEQVRAVLRVRPELVNRVAPSSHGHTALHYAVLGRMPEMVRALMQSGADPCAGAAGIYALRDAASPLAIAMERGYDEIVAVIREEDKRRKGERRCDPADRAERMAGMVRLLRGRGAELTARSAVIAGDKEFLCRKAAEDDLITPRDDRCCLLSFAVDCDRPEILKPLLDFGLDPDARVRVEGDDENSFTFGMPLYQCARYGKYAMAGILLERGADPNGQVYASGTPLSEAYGQRDERMTALLERYGGKSNASMAGLYRPADLARRLLEEFGDTNLPEDGFSKGPVAEQLMGAAVRGGDPEILRMAMERAFAGTARVLEPLDWTVAPPGMGPQHVSHLLQDDSGKVRPAERVTELRRHGSASNRGPGRSRHR